MKWNGLIVGIAGLLVLGGAIGVGAFYETSNDKMSGSNNVLHVQDDNPKNMTEGSNNSQPNSKESVLTKDDAVAIALKETTGTVTKVELDDGYKYEVEIRDGTKEIDFEIDAMTGNIIKMDIDYDDDSDDD